MLMPSVLVRRNACAFAFAVLAAGPILVADDSQPVQAQTAFSQDYATELLPQIEALDAKGPGKAIAAAGSEQKSKTADKARTIVPDNHGCVTSGQLSCNSTISGTITNHGCVLSDDSAYVNFYTFGAVAGQQITITARSTTIDPFLILLDGAGQEITHDDDSGGGLDAQLSATVTQSGQFSVRVIALRAVRAPTGNYTIQLTCSGGNSSCTANSTTLCLNNGRFKVQTRWALPDGRTGDGNAVSITNDTGYFWFFANTNVEMVLKVLNACPSRYWVFAGGLTNVQVTMTVTDTSRGVVKTYVNPLNVAFQPIQDTNAFATCP